MELPPDAFRPDQQPYDPAYDPVHARDPGRNRDYAPTYWIATAGPPPELCRDARSSSAVSSNRRRAAR